jgi:energy-coupling factor transporter ATP-binding protein EcfA2
MPLDPISRQEFLDAKVDVRPGESAVIIGPTGSGKTHLAWQFADVGMRQNQQLQVHAVQPKPADETTVRFADEYGLQVTPDYPFRKKLFRPHPTGYVHWPAHIRDDADKNAEHLSKQFKNSLNGMYWDGNSLVLVDDTYLVGAVYKANRELDNYLTAGRSNDAGIIGCLQAPKGTVHSGAVSSFFYSQPTHMFFFRDNVASNRDKLGQISMGLDPRWIEHTVANLKTYRIDDSTVSDVLYLHRSGPYACVIRPW